MNILLSLAALLTISTSGAAQEFIFPIHPGFRWVDVERPVSRLDKDHFIQAHASWFPIYGPRRTEKTFYTWDSLANHLHFLDINGDGRMDLIFEGQNGAEAQQVAFYFNSGKSWEGILDDMEAVFKMEWRDKKLYRVWIDNWGCCDEYVDIRKVYQLEYDKTNRPKFIQMSQRASINEGEYPDTIAARPVRFEVLNDNYNLRSTAAVDDSSAQRWNDQLKKPYGNIIARLKKGARGYALARKTDATAREWWFVEIDEEFYTSNAAFWKEENLEFPTKMAGWISSRFVKVL